jgi:spermidine synthase|tara:strand:- start:1588 stop:2331 length:744 start_codon:yes stop_codon:yes gene_type:complete
MIWKAYAGRCIYHDSSHDIHLQVHQNMLYRWLTLGSDAIQTLINRRHPERPGLSYIQFLTLAARITPAPSCLLGLGGAGVAHALSPYLGTHILDAIDNNHHIINICSRYFLNQHINNLNIIHQDAFSYVQNTTASRYQHLMIDLFTATSFPENCNHVEFFGHCRRLLLPEGVLAVNLANRHEQWRIFTHIRTHFEHCTVSIPVKGTQNIIIFAYKSTSVQPLLSMLEKQGLKQLTWDAHWGYVLTAG